LSSKKIEFDNKEFFRAIVLNDSKKNQIFGNKIIRDIKFKKYMKNRKKIIKHLIINNSLIYKPVFKKSSNCQNKNGKAVKKDKIMHNNIKIVTSSNGCVYIK
jgi:hypothetical protein